MKPIHFRFLVSDFRFFSWKWIVVLAGLVFTPAALLGTTPGYTNNAYVFFDGYPQDTQPSGFNPMIDAANFVNNNDFFIQNGTLYQTWNTTNFINNSLMSGYIGFWFDLHTANQTPDAWASGFYNPGQINCQNNLTVWATNIVIPGSITINSGTLGGAQLLGKNVDLTRANISMLGGASAGGQIFYYNPTVGRITNSWTPAVNLAMPDPHTPPFVVPPNRTYQIYLSNPDVFVNDSGVVGSNRLVQIVYIERPDASVTNYVSFDPVSGITVQFNGTYVNPATGLLTTNYLIVSDNFGETTNFQLTGTAPYRHPINYNISESSTLSILPPTNGFPAGMTNVLPSGIYGSAIITNAFTYVLANLEPTTQSPNDVANGSVTNLQAQLQVAADNLDLTLAVVSGVNYLSLTATNQFRGNTGAQIVSPYADLNLAVTNGFLAITNLLAPKIPVWDGPCYLWSARWEIVDASGVTNNFHVLFIKGGSLSPFAPAEVQNLQLRCRTNSLTISDALYVFGSFYSDAQSLTLTTNGYGFGATSGDGELNLANNSILWQNALPNLRWLTNNGIITTANSAYFGSSVLPYGALVNRGLISNAGGSFIWANDFENSGTFDSGTGSFGLESLTSTLTNGSIVAGGDVSITTGSLVTSNLMLQAGRSLTLQVTNSLTDTGAANGNVWSVGGASLVGLNLPLLPPAGDLLGTMIFVTSPPNKQVVNTWAGRDRGVSTSGYMNDAAIGRLFLDALGNTSVFEFIGTGGSNALYVNELDLLDNATNYNASTVSALNINANMVVYYATAIINGVDVSSTLDHLNNNHLRWVPGAAAWLLAQNTRLAAGSYSRTNGTFQFSLASLPGQTNIIQASTNLVNWIPIQTNVGPFIFTDSNANYPERFYRDLILGP